MATTGRWSHVGCLWAAEYYVAARKSEACTDTRISGVRTLNAPKLYALSGCTARSYPGPDPARTEAPRLAGWPHVATASR